MKDDNQHSEKLFPVDRGSIQEQPQDPDTEFPYNETIMSSKAAKNDQIEQERTLD